MSVITVLLLAVLAALVAMHFALNFSRAFSGGRTAGTTANGSAPAGPAQVQAFDAPKQRGDSAHFDKRIQMLEKLLLSNGNSVLAYNLKDKLHKLDNFRANTEVELAAIKEILAELKDEKQAPRQKGKENGNFVSEDLRKIVYRSRS